MAENVNENSLSQSETHEDDYGLNPSKLFGKHTWKIEKFSEINKKELRSSSFEIGGHRWYILIYPEGCNVSYHLSLFLCVANYHDLLPGWSHLAQFTVSVLNTKDSKKSKFSDTLHRFWKQEHDWGWKKYMELLKLHDGFIDDSGSLTIEIQVQVIRESLDRPFPCLDPSYRTQFLKMYFKNVENICGHFVKEKRSKLESLIEDKERWTRFGVFWLGMDQNARPAMSREKMDVIVKEVVEQFFIEKEVTSPLVIDSLYSGLKALKGTENEKAAIVSVDKDMFVLVDDLLLLLERAAALEPLPPIDAKVPQNRTKDDTGMEVTERYEGLLTELCSRTLEIFVLDHILSKIEVAYQEVVALKRQEELIREEEETGKRVKEKKQPKKKHVR